MVAVEHGSLGHVEGNDSGTTLVLTTTTAASAGSFIVLSVGWFTQINITGVAGGGLVWTIDKQGRDTVNGPASSNSALISAQAPSGLASGTAITITFSGTPIAAVAGASSFTGVASSPVDTTDGPKGQNTSSTGWTTNSAAISAGSLLIACAYNESNNVTSTPTSPSIEALEMPHTGDGVSAVTNYRIEVSAGSYTVAGTWSGSVKSVTNAVAYLAAAGGGGGGPTVRQLAALGVG